jgi:hypothetical protein
LDLDFKTIQFIELGSAMRLEKPILIGRFEVYIWNTEHAKKHCMGPIFILHKHTMNQAARNNVVPTTEIFMIHDKPNGIVTKQGKHVNPREDVTLKLASMNVIL